MTAELTPAHTPTPTPEPIHRHDDAPRARAVDRFPLELGDLEKFVRALAIAAAIFYVLGLLIVNMYLFQIGVSDFSLLRTRFILTGIAAPVRLLFLSCCLCSDR